MQFPALPANRTYPTVPCQQFHKPILPPKNPQEKSCIRISKANRTAGSPSDNPAAGLVYMVYMDTRCRIRPSPRAVAPRGCPAGCTPCYPRGCTPRRDLGPNAPHESASWRQCETKIETIGSLSAITFFRNCSHRLFSITYDFAPVGAAAGRPDALVIVGEWVGRPRGPALARLIAFRTPARSNVSGPTIRRSAGVSVLTHGWNAGEVATWPWPGVRRVARLVRRRPSRGAARIRRLSDGGLWRK